MLVGQTVLELFIKIIFNNSRTVWGNKILMSFLNFSDNLLADNQIIMFKKKKKNMSVILRYRTKHVQFRFQVQFPLMLRTGCLMLSLNE